MTKFKKTESAEYYPEVLTGFDSGLRTDHSALSTQHSALSGGTQHSALSTEERHSALKSAVLLDKDGTLIEDVPYNCDPRLVRLMPGAVEGLRRLHEAGYLLFVVSNQAGIAHGRFTEGDFSAVQDRLRRLLAEAGVPLSGFYYCPHHPEGTVPAHAGPCRCRKPAPGLLERAAAEHRLRLDASWMIGDILDDVEAGRRAGCTTILLDNGHETEWRLGRCRWPDYLAQDLREAASIITGAERMAAPAVPWRDRSGSVHVG
ncbi:D-glycero-alpha-D-manno-heptose-1,7-bisphosphate 7-phosphatase [Candidatus Nitrospira bockiana]